MWLRCSVRRGTAGRYSLLLMFCSFFNASSLPSLNRSSPYFATCSLMVSQIYKLWSEIRGPLIQKNWGQETPKFRRSFRQFCATRYCQTQNGIKNLPTLSCTCVLNLMNFGLETAKKMGRSFDSPNGGLPWMPPSVESVRIILRYLSSGQSWRWVLPRMFFWSCCIVIGTVRLRHRV